jgi:hypothetical protein
MMESNERTQQSTTVSENLSLVCLWASVITMLAFFGSQVAANTDVFAQIF